jgi:hypothetical protein
MAGEEEQSSPFYSAATQEDIDAWGPAPEPDNDWGIPELTAAVQDTSISTPHPDAEYTATPTTSD